MQRLLILDAHADAAIACVQSLGRAGYTIWVAGARDTDFAFGSRYPERRLIYPDPQWDAGAFLSWLGETVAGGGVDLVLPVTDATLRPCMQNRHHWTSDVPVVLPPESAFDTAFDKEATHALARRLGIPVPESRLITSLEQLTSQDREAGPLYVKPVHSKVWKDGRGHSLVPELVNDAVELDRALARFLPLTPVQLQTYFPGEGVGVEVLCRGGEVVLHFAHRRLHEYPLTGGRSTYREAIRPRPEWLEATRELMRALGWEGVAMVELKVSPRGFALMEINGRFWGSLPLAVASGVDFPRALVAQWLDDRAPVQPVYRIGYRMRNLGFDLVWMRDNWRANRGDPRLLTQSRLLSLAEWLRPLLGREGWDHFSLRDPGPGWRQLRNLMADQGGKTLAVLRRRIQRRRRVRQSVQRVRALGPSVTDVLVLCYGNIYRSPLAAVLLRDRLPSTIRVRSAGFHERAGRRCDEDYVALLQSRGVDLSAHRSATVTYADLEAADLVVIMDERNQHLLRTLHSFAPDKSIWLGAFDGTGDPEIPDPYGKSQEYAERVVGRVEAACAQLSRRLSAGSAGERQISEDTR